MEEEPEGSIALDARLLRSVLYRFVDESSVASLQRDYVGFFRETGARRVLDLGSGRGLFLRLLSEAGIEGVGVDTNADAPRLSPKGARVEVADAVEFLQACASSDERFDGVFCSHLVEHLPGDAALRLIRLASAALMPGGRLVVITPNAGNLWVLTHVFWLDPTHVRPYPRPLVEAIMEECGLSIVRSYDDRRTRRSIGGWRGLLTVPADLLRRGTTPFGGMDSVVVGERPS